MAHRQVWNMCIRLLLLALVALLHTTDASAQQVRVTSTFADIFQWRNAGDSIIRVASGTLLEVIEQDGEWLWVVLPRDVNGTRKVGWVKAGSVEVTPITPGMPVVQLAPVQAPAKQVLTPQRRYSRWSVNGVMGTTFRTETAPLFGGGVSFDATPNLQVTTEFGRMEDVTPANLELRGEQLAARAETLLAVATGRTVDVTAQVEEPAVYGMMGVRTLMPRRSRVRPYATGNLGFATVDPEVRLFVGDDDITGNFVGTGEVPEQRTRLLLGVGGGVDALLVPGVSLDAGYRYMRIYANDGINVNRLYVGVGFGLPVR